MRPLLIVMLALGLAGCGSSSSPPPPLPPPPLPPPSSPSASPWSITQGSGAPHRLQFNGTSSYFDFPVCASASACWVSYVEQPYGPIAGKTSITLTYSITGSEPVFDNHSPGNNCGGPPTLSLLLHQAGDNLSGVGAYAFYRWYSTPTQVLELGDHTLTVPLTIDQWTPVYPGMPDADAGFATAKANIGSVGFGLGGGCFAAHGVAVTSGSAWFTITGFGTQ